MFTNKNVQIYIMLEGNLGIVENAPSEIKHLPLLICKVDNEGAILWCSINFANCFLPNDCKANTTLNVKAVFPEIDSTPLSKYYSNNKVFLKRVEHDSTNVRFYMIEIHEELSSNNQEYIIVAHDKSDEIRERKTKELLLNLAKAERGSKDMKSLFKAIQFELNSVMDAQNLFIVLWDKLRQKLTLPYFNDQYDEFNEFPLGKTLSGYLIEKGEPTLLTEKEILELKSQGVIEIVGTPAKSWMGVPLVYKDETLGLIAIQNYNSDKTYTRDDLLILRHVSNKIALSIERKEHEQALRLAKNKAEEADSLKTSFLANMSHEIRTPMNSIVGFAELITRKNINQDKKDVYAQYISNSSKTLLTIIDDIIDISKIESKQLTITKSNIFINHLIDELFEFFANYLTKSNKKNLILKKHIAVNNNNFCILCDSHRLRQILNNLIINAIKFTPNGSVELGYMIPNNATILFYVKDTGIGLEQGKTDQIFERFRQGDDSTTRKYGGTGLGLAISKRLVNLMGGQIWVESKLGKGSTFYFSLPLIIPSNSEFILKKINDIRATSGSLKNETILIAEDEDTNFFFLQEVLAPTNAKILRVTNGKDAVDTIQNNDEISLVLMDIQMPIMNGYEATHEIKKIKPNLPIIVQTAYAMAEDRAKGARAGCDGYLSKPIKPENLLDTIKQYLVAT